MALKVHELVAKLQELPDDWAIYATRAGSSLEAWEPGGRKYVYVFTDERPTKSYESRRPLGAGIDRIGSLPKEEG